AGGWPPSFGQLRAGAVCDAGDVRLQVVDALPISEAVGMVDPRLYRRSRAQLLDAARERVGSTDQTMHLLAEDVHVSLNSLSRRLDHGTVTHGIQLDHGPVRAEDVARLSERGARAAEDGAERADDDGLHVFPSLSTCQQPGRRPPAP